MGWVLKWKRFKIVFLTCGLRTTLYVGTFLWNCYVYCKYLVLLIIKDELYKVYCHHTSRLKKLKLPGTFSYAYLHTPLLRYYLLVTSTNIPLGTDGGSSLPLFLQDICFLLGSSECHCIIVYEEISNALFVLHRRLN